jgi:hypothetical protein
VALLDHKVRELVVICGLRTLRLESPLMSILI